MTNDLDCKADRAAKPLTSKKKQALLETLEGNPVRDWDSASKLLLARLLSRPDNTVVIAQKR
jgi:hypothetical protein